MFKPISSITKLTTSTLKSCAMAAASTFNSLSNHSSGGDLPSQATIDFWVADTQRGLDAFFNDQFDTAQHIFTQYAAESPFHAVGYALMGYVEAMLGFETERITVALARLSEAQALAHSFAKRAKSGKDYSYHPKKTADNSSDIDVNNLDIGSDSSICFQPRSSTSSNDSDASDREIRKSSAHYEKERKERLASSKGAATELDYELLEANCMLMSATIQFLRDNWIDYMKAAYKLRKAYRMYEHMFETITGITTEKYASKLRKTMKKKQKSQARPRLRTQRINSVPISTVDVAGRSIHPRSISPSLTATLLSASPPPTPLPTEHNPSFTSLPDNSIFFPDLTDSYGLPLPGEPPATPSFAAILANTHHEAPKDKKRYSNWVSRFPFERLANDQVISSMSSTQQSCNETVRSAKQRKRASLPLYGNECLNDFESDIIWPPATSDLGSSNVSIATVDKALHSGVFFGVGLFALIFSLLPPKANKLLNTLGFHSSRPFALHLLHTSYSSSGLYSPLSALTLLAYYTNLSLFVHPQLLPYSLRFQDARTMLEKMKEKYPNGRIWMLVDGKLCKLEGFTRRGVETLRDARRKDSVVRVEDQSSTTAFSSSGKAGKVTGPSNDFPRSRMQQESMNGGMAQLQALAVYEMGWGQIWLGDYFQASETFFRLESMNNWSRAFYHYIATCCMFADEEYDKAAIEFLQIPDILRRQKQLGGRLLPNEIFAERKILGWKKKADLLDANREGRTPSPTQGSTPHGQSLNGDALRQTVIVNPLWELIYLWNGIPHVNADVLMQMKTKLETQIAKISDIIRRQAAYTDAQNPNFSQDGQSDAAILYLLYATVIRELGNLEESREYLTKLIAMDKQIHEDRWAIAYGMYEMAIVAAMDPNRTDEARKWVHKAENFFQSTSYHQAHAPSDLGSNNGDYDWENRLHVRCQLLLERLDEM